jgi:hypothetical protein
LWSGLELFLSSATVETNQQVSDDFDSSMTLDKQREGHEGHEQERQVLERK